jgi:4-amino-4-deoxy-L-arabinose transferase-like glycosyltransferase
MPLRRHIFFLLLGLALFIRLAYVFFLPLGQTVRFRLEGLNDEPSHLNYVHYLAEHKSFPIQSHHVRETDSFVRNEFEYFQPPIYYVVGAGLELLFGKSAAQVTCRLMSFVFGILSLLVIHRIFSRFGFPQTVCQAAVLFAAFFPANAYFCSVVSNDSLSWLFCLLLTLEIAPVSRPYSSLQPDRRIWPTAIRIGLLLAAGMLIKSSLFIFYPVMAALFLYRWFISRNWQWLTAGCAALVLSVVFAAPWYVHNQHLYGSFFAFGIGNGPPQFFLFSPHTFYRFLIMTFRFFWFPMQHVQASATAAIVVKIEALLLIINVVLFAFYVRSRRSIDAWKLLLVLLVVANAAAYISFNLHWDNAEGRYLFPSLVPMLLFFCVPVSHYCRRFGLSPQAVILILCAEALFPYVNLLLIR